MRHISCSELASLNIHGGENFAFGKCDLPFVGECDFFYPNAKFTKKIVEKAFELGAVMNFVGLAKPDKDDLSLSKNFSYMARAAVLKFASGLVEDLGFDPLYDYWGLEKG